MMLVDRSEVLARTDLAELATQICGEPVGRGRSAKWHCPNPDHPDQHPSMGLYRSKHGHPRWKCHSCGEGGTAVDLLMISTGLGAGQALRELATRAGFHLDDRSLPSRPPRRPTPRVTRTRPSAVARPEPGPVIEKFVAGAADLLWQPVGAGARRYLHQRGLTEPILRANRVGFDPGPRHLARPDGLPRRGPGVVYPVLNPTTSRAIYYQVRYLDPATAAVRKYDQPITELAANPTLAHIRNPTPPPSGTFVVCEGFPDALTAAHTGLAAAAILGATHQPATLAARLTRQWPGAAFIVAFDADQPGTTAAYHLAAHLARNGATVARIAPPDTTDLNAWWQTDPTILTHQLTATAQMLNSVTLPAADLAIAR